MLCVLESKISPAFAMTFAGINGKALDIHWIKARPNQRPRRGGQSHRPYFLSELLFELIILSLELLLQWTMGEHKICPGWLAPPSHT